MLLVVLASRSRRPAGKTVMTRLSIVTLSFNQADFLRRALDSVRLQDYPFVEHVVVDPGSSDGSRELLSKRRNSLAHLILEADDGPAVGLNRGFDRCSGAIFGYLNADDEYVAGALHSVAEEFERRPDIDVLYGDGWIIDDRSTRVRKVWSDPFNVKQYARGTSVVLQQATFFRRRLWDAGIRFNAANRTSWDGEFLVEAAGWRTICTRPTRVGPLPNSSRLNHRFQPPPRTVPP